MAQTTTINVHRVQEIGASAEIIDVNPVRTIAVVNLNFGDSTVTLFLDAGRASYATDLADAINAVAEKHRTLAEAA